jgi:gamma-glutamyltranspeptidase/glutathione hydrolase
MDNQSDVTASSEGLVSVSHPIAAKVGKDVLDQGGTAIDAVIAIQCILNVVEPYMSGLGGGGYLLYYDHATQQVTTFDARETAPSHVDTEFYLDNDGNHLSFFDLSTHGSAIGIPGIPKLFDYLMNNYATLELANLINPAIQLAQEGHRANWATQKYSWHQIERIKKYPETYATYTNAENDYFHEGDWVRLPALSKTFEYVRDNGFDAFYHGDIAHQIVQATNQAGGQMTLEDLHNYDIQIKAPVTANYRGYDIYTIGPSSSGGITVLQILKMMEQFNLKNMGSRSTQYLHTLIQAMHLAYSDRAQYSTDNTFHHVPINELLNEDYLKNRSNHIQSQYANFNINHGVFGDQQSNTNIDEQHTETTHYSVTDRYGNVASFTTSIGMIYGSGITVPGYGLLLNTTMNDFDVVKGGINEIEPGKRPISSMTPTIIMKDAKPFMEVGSPGAISIIACVVQTIINVLDFDMSIQQAINEPRIYSSNPSRIEWEPQFSQSIILELINKGHAMERKPEAYIGDVHGLRFNYNNDKNNGATDSQWKINSEQDNDSKSNAENKNTTQPHVFVSGGADDTREGTVMGGNVYIKRNQAPQLETYEIPEFNVYVNNVALPLRKFQAFREDDVYWLDLTIADHAFAVDVESGNFNNDSTTDDKDNTTCISCEKLANYIQSFTNQEYIQLIPLAKQLNYSINIIDDDLYLSKNAEQRIDENAAAYYRYDKDSITR